MGDLSLWSEEVEANSTYEEVIEEPILIVEETNKKKDEIDMFTLDQVQFELPANLNWFAVNNNQLVLLMDNLHFLVVDLLMEDDILDIPLPKDAGIPHKIFIDVTGQHIFISTLEKKFYYYHKKLEKVKLINKLNGYLVESIAFDKSINERSISTGYILLGCTEGSIFEMIIEAKEDSLKHVDKKVKKIYKFKEDITIYSIYYEPFPTDPQQFYIIITSNTRLYQFIGKTKGFKKNEPTRFYSILDAYGNDPIYQDIPSEIKYSETHYFSKNVEKEFHSLVSNFAWLTGAGIYYGEFIFGSQEKGGSLIENGQLIPYPNQEIPLSISLTEFHILLLYEHKIVAISKLTFEVIYNQSIPKRLGNIQHAKQLIMDHVRRTFWLHTGDTIYEIIITQEDRNVWKYYLNKKMFSEALKYAKTNKQKDKILFEQASKYFDTKRYHLSATYFGKCIGNFEQICLMFINVNEMDALRTYLLIKLENINKKNVTQTIMLSTWIIELYLVRINEMEESSLNETEDNNATSQPILEEIELLVKEFHKFLYDHQLYLNKKVVYQLISNYGRTDQFIYFAEIMKDFNTVIDHFIQIHQFLQALQMLGKQESNQLYYKYSVILMQHVPLELVDLLIRNHKLHPIKLIPAILKYDPIKFNEIENQAIRYLQYVIVHLNCRQVAIHNLLLSLYVTQTNDDEKLLLAFLMREDRCFSLDYALRLCYQYHKVQSIIFIYGLLELYDEAVNTSLKYGDIELAKINADKVEEDYEKRKSLWLQIVQYIIEDKKDINGAIQLLQHSDVIKIEDILPYFPDFVLIDDFKEEICNALEDYNKQIIDIKNEMDSATTSAEKLLHDLQLQKDRYVLLKPNQSCYFCCLPVLHRQFYLFPCHHCFHSDCLIKKVSQHLSATESKNMNNIQSQLTKEITQLKSVDSEHLDAKRALINELKDQLDVLLASDCFVCGEMAVKLIDQPLIVDKDFEDALSFVI